MVANGRTGETSFPTSSSTAPSSNYCRQTQYVLYLVRCYLHTNLVPVYMDITWYDIRMPFKELRHYCKNGFIQLPILQAPSLLYPSPQTVRVRLELSFSYPSETTSLIFSYSGLPCCKPVSPQVIFSTRPNHWPITLKPGTGSLIGAKLKSRNH